MAINRAFVDGRGHDRRDAPGQALLGNGAVAADPSREASADSTGSTASLSLTRATRVAQNRISAVICSTDLERSLEFYEQKVRLALSPATIPNHLVFEAGDARRSWCMGARRPTWPTTRKCGSGVRTSPPMYAIS